MIGFCRNSGDNCPRGELMRNVISNLDYFRRDVLGILFAIQSLVLAVNGKALFPVGTAKPRFSVVLVKALWARYLCAVVAAAALAGVAWDLHRRFPR